MDQLFPKFGWNIVENLTNDYDNLHCRILSMFLGIARMPWGYNG